MDIPLIDLRQQYQPLKDQILAGMARALDGMQLVLGENMQAFDAMAFLGHKAGDLPVAEQAAVEALSLPMYPDLIDEEIELVADSIRVFYGL